MISLRVKYDNITVKTRRHSIEAYLRHATLKSAQCRYRLTAGARM